MANKKTKPTTSAAGTADSISLNVKANTDKTVAIDWHIETAGSTVFWDGLKCNRNDGNPDFIFAHGPVGTGSNAQKDGAYTDSGVAIDNSDPNQPKTIQKPFVTGDTVTYQLTAFIVTDTERYAVFGPRLTVLIP